MHSSLLFGFCICCQDFFAQQEGVMSLQASNLSHSVIQWPAFSMRIWRSPCQVAVSCLSVVKLSWIRLPAWALPEICQEITWNLGNFSAERMKKTQSSFFVLFCFFLLEDPVLVIYSTAFCFSLIFLNVPNQIPGYLRSMIFSLTFSSAKSQNPVMRRIMGVVTVN